MRRWLVALPVVLLLAGCGQTSTAAVQRTADHPAGHHVKVGLNEWQIDLAPTRALAGRVTLTVTNAGATEHNLVVQAGAHRWALPALSPGQHRQLVVRAPDGATLQLSSDQPGQLRPMKATLPVSR